jgi:hypothetical protein
MRSLGFAQILNPGHRKVFGVFVSDEGLPCQFSSFLDLPQMMDTLYTRKYQLPEANWNHK